MLGRKTQVVVQYLRENMPSDMLSVVQKREKKRLVVAKKHQAATGGRNVKMVDRRLKTDTRGQKGKEQGKKGKGAKGKPKTHAGSSVKGGSRQKKGRQYSRKSK